LVNGHRSSGLRISGTISKAWLGALVVQFFFYHQGTKPLNFHATRPMTTNMRKWFWLALYIGLLLIITLVYMQAFRLPKISDPAAFFKLK
jgi:hypothetical protein